MGKLASVYFSPDRGTADVVIGFIDRCQGTLNAAVYAITHDGIADALVRAHQRGVKVRVLTDKLMASGKSSVDEKLEASGVEVRVGTHSGLMHNKFITDGDRAVATGSMNWTMRADERNAENWVVLRLKYLVAEFCQEFERLWEDSHSQS